MEARSVGFGTAGATERGDSQRDDRALGLSVAMAEIHHTRESGVG